jgi:hypothetical protein
MQTFLPNVSYSISAVCLDDKRLGKQRVEVLQILRALSGEKKGWVHHPAVKMWRGNEIALIQYGIIICATWRRRRGYRDTCHDKIWRYMEVFTDGGSPLEIQYPPWLTEEFCSVHRSILLAKDPIWYSQWNWEEEPAKMINGKWPYIWPV